MAKSIIKSREVLEKWDIKGPLGSPDKPVDLDLRPVFHEWRIRTPNTEARLGYVEFNIGSNDRTGCTIPLIVFNRLLQLPPVSLIELNGLKPLRLYESSVPTMIHSLADFGAYYARKLETAKEILLDVAEHQKKKDYYPPNILKALVEDSTYGIPDQKEIEKRRTLFLSVVSSVLSSIRAIPSPKISRIVGDLELKL